VGRQTRIKLHFRSVSLAGVRKMKKGKKKKKQKKIKVRNWIAVHAFQRSGAGRHKDKKKHASKYACRKTKNK